MSLLLPGLPIALLVALLGCSADKTGDDTEGGGGTAIDLDGDGYGGSADCDDNSSAIFPGADERCNNVDDNCDGNIDEAGVVDGLTEYPDADGDGWGSDAGATVCTGVSGYILTSGDCDDANATINPDTEEACDGVDNDCDSLTDEPGATGGNSYSIDRDRDGYGHPTQTGTACAPGDGFVEDNSDCDDGDPARNPGEFELCGNEQDDDCDGATDEVDENTVAPTWYLDSDGDGYGTSLSTVDSCDHPDGYASSDTDCDDGDADVNPGAFDWSDGVDNDCDGETDEIGTNFDGTFTFQSGEGEDPDDRDCAEYWTTSGAPDSRECPECEWTFSVDFTYDDSASTATGRDCLSDMFGTDFNWELGFISGYEGRDMLVLWYEEEWYPIFYADWDDTTGELKWYYGVYEEREYWGYDGDDTGAVSIDTAGPGPRAFYYYYSEPYYYTNWFYGHSSVLP